MNNANLYVKSNNFQRLIIQKVFNEFSPMLRNQVNDGGDSVLDIGSGAGDVTMELVLPSLPSNVRRLVGCDVSNEMIDFARQHYNHPNVSFDKLDIGDTTEVVDFLKNFGSFNHVVSFFCLNWVPNQRSAIENIYRLLTWNGDALLVLLTSTVAYTVYVEMSRSSRWSMYMHDAKRYTSPYHWVANPEHDLRSLLQTAGFGSSDVRVQRETYLCRNFEEFGNIVRSVNPFVDRIPATEQKDFIEETVRRLMAKNKELREEDNLISIENCLYKEILKPPTNMTDAFRSSASSPHLPEMTPSWSTSQIKLPHHLILSDVFETLKIQKPDSKPDLIAIRSAHQEFESVLS